MPGVDALAPPNRPRRPIEGVHDGRVHSVDGATVMLLLPDFDNGRYTYGPAPWPAGTTDAWSPTDSHRHDLPTPEPGWWCAVAFVGGDPDRPRVLAVYPDWEPDE